MRRPFPFIGNLRILGALSGELKAPQKTFLFGAYPHLDAVLSDLPGQLNSFPGWVGLEALTGCNSLFAP